ncbi:MAG: AraC family transcriptional regulator [Acidimicrobiaceae bacterium]|nr:AraC family transcriptional regulator [Acidimicrobiaceae bacterium]
MGSEPAAPRRVSIEPAAAVRPFLDRPLVAFSQSRFDEPLSILPSPTVTLMVQTAQPLDGTPRAFIAGPSMGPLTKTWQGAYACVDIKLSPLGAAALFGPILGELTGATVDLREVFPGREGEVWIEQLIEAGDGRGRLRCAERLLLERSREPYRPDRRIVEAWSELRRGQDHVRIGGLVRDSGWSHRYFIDQFRRHIGLTPMAAARLLRASRAMRHLRQNAAVSLAEVAVECGYADQAHMSREVRQLTGMSPAQFRRKSPETAAAHQSAAEARSAPPVRKL